MAYFERIDSLTVRPTAHTGGAWTQSEQHIAPALGLLAHLVEVDRDARRDDGLPLVRLACDILGPVPVQPCTHEVRVVRPGRTIELVEATLSHGGRAVAVARAWLVAAGETSALEHSDLPPMPAPGDTEPWDPSSVWSGGFIASVEVRREAVEPGRGRVWVRTDVPLVDEPHSHLAATAGLLDIANGMNVLASPREVLFPNVDLTAHLFRQPEPGWLGLDTTVSFGPAGHGLTSSVLHDERGAFGTLAQVLTVRPVSPSA
ncbi:thioesterase family protein [Janibacter sp. RAF52]|uniref:thioesterase family protein n=1 Tax=unclassified Janibacter TaxID=2649294 RepID=UPI003F8DF6D4